MPEDTLKYLLELADRQTRHRVKSVWQERQFASRHGTTRLAERLGPIVAGMLAREWQVPVAARKYLAALDD